MRLGPLSARAWTPTDWFVRWGRHGISVQRPAHPDGFVVFSECMGYRKAWHILGACIKTLG
jgi:hypothetical protein